MADDGADRKLPITESSTFDWCTFAEDAIAIADNSALQTLPVTDVMLPILPIANNHPKWLSNLRELELC